MKKGLLAGLGLVVAVSLALLLASGRNPANLRYQGKSIGEWARQSMVGSPAARTQASLAFKALGTNALPGLLKLLQTRDSALRKGIWSLTPKLPSFARRVVEKRVRLPDAEVMRTAAARWLGSLGPEAQAAVPALARALRADDSQQVRWEAAVALGRLGGPGIPELLSVLSSQNPNLRYAAVSGLGEARADADAAGSALLGALDDPDMGVRVSVGGALEKLSTNLLAYATNAAVNGDAPTRQRAARALGSLHAPRDLVLPALLQVAHDTDAKCREQALRTLNVLGLPNNNMTETYIAAVADPVPEVRLAAVQALGHARWQGELAVPALRKCLSDESPQVREWAARTLGSFGGLAESASADLTRLLTDKEPAVRSAAQEALKKLQ